MRKSHLKLVYSRADAAPKFVDENGELAVASDEFTLQILTRHHGPSCAHFLAHHFRRDRLHRGGPGYFIVRLPKGEVIPLWVTIAMRFFKQRDKKWRVGEFTTSDNLMWRVSYLQHPKLRAEKTNLRVV